MRPLSYFTHVKRTYFFAALEGGNDFRFSRFGVVTTVGFHPFAFSDLYNARRNGDLRFQQFGRSFTSLM